jgi:hypothetical protein
MRIISQTDWFTVRVLSKEEFEQEEQRDQKTISTDLENDPEIDPSTDVGGDGDDEEASEALADVLKRLSNGQAKRSNIRDASQLHVTEKKANQPAPAPEPTRTSVTSEALVAAMQRAREAKSKE